MFRNLINECTIKFTLKPETPLLIRSGEKFDLNPSLPRVRFIRSRHNGGDVVVIPGSSLKGVFRSRSEKLLEASCPVFYQDCSKQLKALAENKKMTAREKYEKSCAACKLFGNLSLKSRIMFRDAFPVKGTVKLSTRYNVAINRVTGASMQNALFDMEVLEEGTFEAEIIMQNFFKWQLKTVMQVFEHVNEGLVAFGGMTSRGFGKMQADVQVVRMRVYGKAEGEELYGEKAFTVDEVVQWVKDVDINHRREQGKVEWVDEYIL